MILKHLMALSVASCMASPCAFGQTAEPTAATPPAEAVISEETISPETLNSAKEAVKTLCKEVEMGRYKYAIQHMNPTWKKRTAERMGGIQQLENQLDQVAAMMVQQGISIISSTPTGTPSTYEVSPIVVNTPGQPAASKWMYSKWLVMIPTLTRCRIIQKGKSPILIDSQSFQVAISEKGKNDWTFIDGASLSVSDLCSLFPTLPKTLKLPPVHKVEDK